MNNRLIAVFPILDYFRYFEQILNLASKFILRAFAKWSCYYYIIRRHFMGISHGIYRFPLVQLNLENVFNQPHNGINERSQVPIKHIIALTKCLIVSKK